MESDYCELSLDGCKHGLPNREIMKPSEEGFEMGQVGGITGLTMAWAM